MCRKLCWPCVLTLSRLCRAYALSQEWKIQAGAHARSLSSMAHPSTCSPMHWSVQSADVCHHCTGRGWLNGNRAQWPNTHTQPFLRTSRRGCQAIGCVSAWSRDCLPGTSVLEPHGVAATPLPAPSSVSATLLSRPAARWCPSAEFELCVTVNHLELQPHGRLFGKHCLVTGFSLGIWLSRGLGWTGEPLPSPSKPSRLPAASPLSRSVGWPECGICPPILNSETDFAGGLSGLIKEA